MKKLNKKGFTLVEMLVVIAIIAVLVAIIVPIVSSANVKAAAATNAANLRSYLAEYVTWQLTGEEGAAAPTAPTAKKCGSYAAGTETAHIITVSASDTTPKDAAFDEAGTKNIEYFSYIAEHGKPKQ